MAEARTKERGGKERGGKEGGTRGAMGRQRKKICPMCIGKVMGLDFQAVESYRRYVTDRGKISKRRQTGMCAKHQRMLAETIKKARVIGLVPYFVD